MLFGFFFVSVMSGWRFTVLLGPAQAGKPLSVFFSLFSLPESVSHGINRLLMITSFF